MANYRKKARKNANRGNYQDAFADAEKSKELRTMGRGSMKGGAIPTDSTDNDPSWYTPNGLMAKDVASVAFGYPNGLSFPIMEETEFGSSGITKNVRTPGIFIYETMLQYGKADGKTDPLNVAAQNVYLKMRSSTSGQSYYEANDVGMTLAAVDNLYSFYSWVVRLYGLMNSKSNPLNKYIPKDLVYANHVNYRDLEENIADFRAWINRFAFTLAGVAVPKNIDIFKRHIFMYENLYTDANSIKSQYYMYVPFGFWVYDELDTPSTLRPYSLFALARQTTGDNNNNPTKFLTFQDLRIIGERLLDPILQSDSVRYIAADILKSYGDGGVFKVYQIDETYSITPSYNQEVLAQMENAWVLPQIATRYNYDQAFGTQTQVQTFYTQHSSFDRTSIITGVTEPNNSYIRAVYSYVMRVTGLEDPLIVANQSVESTNVLVNSHIQGDVSPDKILVDTRLTRPKTITEQTSSTNYGTHYVSTIQDAGSEVVAAAWMVIHQEGSVPSFIRFNSVMSTIVSESGGNIIKLSSDVGGLLNYVLSFDWSPRFYLIDQESTPDGIRTAGIIGPMWDLDNWTILNRTTLDNINYNAILGEIVPK